MNWDVLVLSCYFTPDIMFNVRLPSLFSSWHAELLKEILVGGGEGMWGFLMPISMPIEQ